MTSFFCNDSESATIETTKAITAVTLETHAARAELTAAFATRVSFSREISLAARSASSSSCSLINTHRFAAACFPVSVQKAPPARAAFTSASPIRSNSLW